jgi:hypothetical protein
MTILEGKKCMVVQGNEMDQRILGPVLRQNTSSVSRLETVPAMSEPKESRLVEKYYEPQIEGNQSTYLQV